MDITENELIELLKKEVIAHRSQLRLALAISEKLGEVVFQPDISAYVCGRKRVSVSVAKFLGYELRKERIFKPIEIVSMSDALEGKDNE